jgi:hypothetical protein
MEKRIDRSTEGAQVRPPRTPIGTRNILTTEKRPGFHRVWVSDSPSLRIKLQDYEAAGYTYVEDDIKVGDDRANSGQKVSSKVTRPGGQGTMLFLMEIPEEYYQDDIKSQDAKLREKEAQMFSPKSIEGGYGSTKSKQSTVWNTEL